MRPTKEEYFMEVARLTAQMSTCKRLQVGVVLTDERHESFWIGYNGGPRAGRNECRDEATEGGCGCVHAEANAVIKAPGHIRKRTYITHSPCVTCAVMLVNAHVVSFTYAERYRDTTGLEVLMEAGINVYQSVPDTLTYSGAAPMPR